MNDQSQFLTPFQRKLLLKQMQIELRPEYRRRIEIMLLADDGQSQTEICAMLGCSQETARHWIGMARAGRAHQWDDCPVGRPQVINDQYVDRLKELVNRSPRDYGYPFKRWTAQVLSKHLANELGIDISNRHINRLLKKWDFPRDRATQARWRIYPEPKILELRFVIYNPHHRSLRFYPSVQFK